MSAVSYKPKGPVPRLSGSCPLGRTHTRQVASIYICDGPSQWLLCDCWVPCSHLAELTQHISRHTGRQRRDAAPCPGSPDLYSLPRKTSSSDRTMLFRPGSPPSVGHSCSGTLGYTSKAPSRFSRQHLTFTSVAVSSGDQSKLGQGSCCLHTFDKSGRILGQPTDTGPRTLVTLKKEKFGSRN